MADIEIKRGYEVLPDNNIRFGIRITNISDVVISDVEVILDYSESLFKLEGERMQKVGVIPPASTRTAEFILKPLGCVHKVNIEALISYRDTKYARQRIDMHPKEVHCVCPFLKGKAMPRAEFLKLSSSGHSAEMGLNFKGVSVERLASYLVQTCKNRHYKVDDYSVDGGRMLYLASESIGEKAYYLLTALIKDDGGLTQVMLRVVSDKSHGLNGFLNETVAELRHVVSSVQSAQEIGIIKKQQVINIIDSIVQRTIFNGSGEGATRINIDGSAVTRTKFVMDEDKVAKKQNEKEIMKMDDLDVYEYLAKVARSGCNEQNVEFDLSSKVGRKKLCEQEDKIIVTYGGIVENFTGSTNDIKALSELWGKNGILNKINKKTIKYDIPILLSALVINQNDFLPSDQFFETWLPNTKDEDKLSTWIKELEKIWQYYCK